MNEDEEKKKKQQPGNNEQPVDNSVDASQQYVQGVVDAAQKSAAATAQYNADVQKANSAYQDVVGQILDYGEQLRKEREEAQLQQTLDGNKAAFGGVTQAVAALFNQHFVNKGASNQVYHDYASDWMKEADKKRQENKMRLDNIREKQRQAQMQIEQMKHANSLAEAKMKHEDTMAQLGVENARNEAEYKVAQNQQAAAAKIAELESKYRIAIMDNQTKMAIANLNNQAKMMQQGYMPDGNGGYVYDEELAKRNGKSGGGGSVIPITLSAFGDLPQETININSNSLVNTVKINVLAGVIDDLSEADQQALMSLIGNSRAAALDGTSGKYSENIDRMLSYVVKSPKLRNLVKEAAANTAASAPEQPTRQEDPDAVVLDENGFPE